MPVSEKTYRQMALEDPEGHWELYCGSLRRKPGMSLEHNRCMSKLHFALMQQLDADRFDVRSNAGHVRLPTQSYYIPDVFVIPIELQEPLRGQHVLETYDAPLPLVVEIWSPSTAGYDVETKLRDYHGAGTWRSGVSTCTSIR